MKEEDHTVFTWIPIYTELAKQLHAYRNIQNELIDMLKDLEKQGLPVGSIVDHDQNDAEIPLTVIDPFTFFGCFNRSLTAENRRKMLVYFKVKLGLRSDVPQDFGLGDSWRIVGKSGRNLCM